MGMSLPLNILCKFLQANKQTVDQLLVSKDTPQGEVNRRASFEHPKGRLKDEHPPIVASPHSRSTEAIELTPTRVEGAFTPHYMRAIPFLEAKLCMKHELMERLIRSLDITPFASPYPPLVTEEQVIAAEVLFISLNPFIYGILSLEILTCFTFCQHLPKP